MNKNEEFKIRKVYLDTFINILMDLYDKGVDYIDIIGSTDDTQDVVKISFSKEYMNKEMLENFEKLPSSVKKEDKINLNLSDDDINQLL